MGDHSPATALYNLRWDAQQSALLGSVATLLKEEAFVDTTVVADGQVFKAHRLLLSASSPFLKTILQSVPCEHSVLMFPHINAADLKNVLRFIYEGEIKIKQGELKSFLQVAKLLKIKGMDFDMGEENECETTSTSRPHEERNHKEVNMPAKENHQDRNFEDSYYSEVSRVESSLPDGAIASEDDANMGIDDTDGDEHSNMQNDHFDDEKDYTEIMLDDDNEVDDDGEGECTENDDDEDEYPLQPEVSFNEADETLAMSSGLEIKSVQSMRASWNMPHSSTSATNNNNLGMANRNSRPGFGKPPNNSQQHSSTNSGKDGILLRMMREPLKSSTTASSFANQAPYISHDSNLRKTKRYVQCRSCSKVLSSLSALKRHMEDVHCARIQGKCLICGRVYSSRNSLLTHVYSAHKKHHDYKAVARIIRESDFEKFTTV